MISEGEVGAVFTVVDEASPVLRAIAAQFNVLQASIDKLKVAFKEIKLPPGVAASINKMTAAMDKAVAAGGKLETSMGDIGVAADAGAFKAAAGFGRIDGAIATTQGKLAALKAELRATGGVGGIRRRRRSSWHSRSRSWSWRRNAEAADRSGYMSASAR